MNDQAVTVTNSDVVDRLARLRSILPQMATDLALARRHASALEAENAVLRRQLRELESRVTEPRRPRPPASRSRGPRSAPRAAAVS
jgi:hypothetical protein